MSQVFNLNLYLLHFDIYIIIMLHCSFITLMTISAYIIKELTLSPHQLNKTLHIVNNIYSLHQLISRINFNIIIKKVDKNLKISNKKWMPFNYLVNLPPERISLNSNTSSEVSRNDIS